MMRNPPSHLSPQRLARIAGLLYLAIAISGGFAQIVRTSMIEPGDAAATTANILDAEWLFRLSFLGDVVAFSAEVVLAVVFFALLRPVNESLAVLAAGFRLAQAAVLGINLLNQFVVLLLLGGDDYLSVFEPAQLHALALFFLEAHGYGYLIGLVFFALHNVVLGYLLIKSGYVPRVLGFLVMVVVSAGYLIDSVGNFLVADWPGTLSAVVLTPAALVEFALIGWLLVRGVSDPARPDRSSVPANMVYGER
jgi:Domain of unknown function (DUF4386)